jgi:signal transduction histidine kinase
MPLDHPAGARILVVDDEEANVDLLEQMLGGAGYTNLVSTTDPRRALPLFQEREPDLVLLDLHMPHLDGFAVMAQIADVVPEESYVPILVLTADITRPARERALAAGALDFVTKPFDRTELLQRIRNLLRTRYLHLGLQRQIETLDHLHHETKASMQAWETLFSSVSHDLGQPLSTIKLMASYVGSQATRATQVDGSWVAVQMGHIDFAVRKMLTMVGEMLDLSRLEVGRPLDLDYDNLDLVALVQQEVDGCRQTTNRHEFAVVSAADVIAGEWDEMRLRRVFSNLLSNAVRYSPDGGRILVHVEIERATDSAAATAVVTISDHGVGIPAADLPHISERFFRAGNVAGRIGGTGLGLAGARQIVELHGGTLAISSVEGEGTAVTVRLPILVTAEPEDTAEHRPTSHV